MSETGSATCQRCGRPLGSSYHWVDGLPCCSWCLPATHRVIDGETRAIVPGIPPQLYAGVVAERDALAERVRLLEAVAQHVEYALCDQEDNFSGPDYPELRALLASHLDKGNGVRRTR